MKGICNNDKNKIKKKLTKCPICFSQEIKYKFSTGDIEYHVVDQIFDIYFCKKCKAYFINPIPKENEIGKFYEFHNYSSYGAYKGINPEIKYSKIDRLLINKKNITFKDRIYFSIRGIDNRILDLVMYKNNKHIIFQNVLDVGCGSGFFTKWLIKYLKISKNNIRGIDIFSEVKKFGKTMGVKMECTTLQKYPESGFDLITLSHVLEHEPKPKMMIEQIYNKLSKNGIFYLSVPNSRSLPALLFGAKWICHSVPRHIYSFSKKSIIEITKRLFQLEYYSSGDFARFMFSRYNRLKPWMIFFNTPVHQKLKINRLVDLFLILFNLGDSQSFIFKKK